MRPGRRPGRGDSPSPVSSGATATRLTEDSRRIISFTWADLLLRGRGEKRFFSLMSNEVLFNVVKLDIAK